MCPLEIVPVISDQLFNRQINLTDQNATRIPTRYTPHLGNNRVNLGPIGGVERQQPVVRRFTRNVARIYGIVSKLIVLDQKPEYIHPKPIHAAIQPEP